MGMNKSLVKSKVGSGSGQKRSGSDRIHIQIPPDTDPQNWNFITVSPEGRHGTLCNIVLFLKKMFVLPSALVSFAF